LILSRSSQYAIRAVTYICEQRNRLCRAPEVARATGIPRPYLWKILRKLTDSRVLISCKGVKGGYRAARDPRHINMAEILAAFSENVSNWRCVLDDSECNSEHPCAFHKPLNAFQKRLERITIADLKKRGSEKP